MDDGHIGARIRELRKQAGLGQAELGAMIDVDQSAVSRIEKGERQITAGDLLRLSNGLGISIDEMLSPETNQPALLRSSENSDGLEALKLLNHCIDEFRGLEHLDS